MMLWRSTIYVLELVKDAVNMHRTPSSQGVVNVDES